MISAFMETNNFCCYEFGEYRLDAKRRLLTKNGERIPLSSRNFDLLLFMVENSNRILEHDELLDNVWAGVFVEQATLKKGISTLRQILGATPENEYIKTLPRRGYSFTSPVRIVTEADEKFIFQKTDREIIIEEYEEITDEPSGLDSPAQLEQKSPSNAKKIKLSYLAAFAGAAVVISALTFFGIKIFSSKNVETRFSAENVRITKITNNGKVRAGTAVSQDGSYIIYPAGDKDGASLWLKQLSTNTARKLTEPVNGSYWSFAIAPDNSYVYYVINNLAEPQKSGLYKVPMLGGEPQRLAQNVGAVAASPTGKQILLAGSRNGNLSLFTLDTNGENEHIFKSFPANYRIWDMGWTPDGSSIICTLRKVVDDKNLYYVAEIAPDTGKENIILPDQEKILFGAYWLPDKSSLLVLVREPNAEIRQLWQYFPQSQDWRRITNDNNSYKTVSLTRDGKAIFSCQESRLAAIWVSDGDLPKKSTDDKKEASIGRNNFRQITDGIRDFDKIGWLADGRLFYSGNEDGKDTIFTIGADGTNSRQITQGDDGIRIFPGSANSGQNISFISAKIDGRQLWRIDAEGKNLTQLTKIPNAIYDGRILRDNATIIYEMQIPGNVSLLYKQTPDRQSVPLTETETGAWAVSPDETMFAVEIMDANTRKFHVELRSIADGKMIRTFNFSPSRQIEFTPDGKYLSYDATRGDVSQIMLQAIDGGEPISLTDFQTDEIFSFDWSPDGKRLALVRGKQLNDAVVIKAN